MPNLSIEWDPLTNEFLNSANNQPVTPDGTDTVTIGADPGGAWAGGYSMTLPANFTCKQLNVQDGVTVTEPSGGTLTGNVYVGGGATKSVTSILQLGTDGSAPTVLNGSLTVATDEFDGRGAVLNTHGPVSIQGPAGSAFTIDGEVSVQDGQLDVHNTVVLVGTPEIGVSTGATLNMVTSLTPDQVNRIISGMQLATVGGILGSGTLLVNGSVANSGSTIDLAPPPTQSGESTPNVTLGSTGELQNGTVNFGPNVSFLTPVLSGITATGEMDVGAGQSVTIQDGFGGTATLNMTGLLLTIDNITDLTGHVLNIGSPGNSAVVEAQGTGAGLTLGEVNFFGSTDYVDGTGLSNLVLQNPVTLLPEDTSYNVQIRTFKLTLPTGATVTVDSGGSLTTTGIIDNQGAVNIAGGTVDFGNVRSPNGYGQIVFLPAVLPPSAPSPAPQGSVQSASQPEVQATAPGGTLEFAQPGVAATLVDFTSADAVDILGNFGNTKYHLSLASNVLTVLDQLGDPLGTFTLVSTTGVTYDLSQFAVNDDTGNGALLSAPGIAACFAAGTRIHTPHGEVPVEALRAGAMVLAHTGDAQVIPHPVVWIGHRRVDCRYHLAPKQVWPVRVAIGAFAPGQPTGELYLSPDHAVFVDDVLIPVKYLINGTSIAQVQMDHVTYYHVELPEHAILLAEGLPTESYLDTGDRSNFDNGGRLVRAHPDFSVCVREARGCAPLIVTGLKLEAVRRQVNARAVGVMKRRTPWAREHPASRLPVSGRQGLN